MDSVQQKSVHYQFGAFLLRPVERLLLKNDHPLPLTPKVFDLLLFLVENQGRLLTKDEIMEAVWHDAFVEEGTLARTVSMLRKSLGENPHEFVVTVPKKGYRFTAEVERISTSDQKIITEENFQPPEKVETQISEAKFAERQPRNHKTKWLITFGVLAVLAISFFGLRAWFSKKEHIQNPNAATNKNEAKQLTNSNLAERFIGWTSDGRIIFDRGDANEIFFINSDGSGEAKAVASVPLYKNGWLAPDESKIVFKKPDKAFYIADANGSNEMKLDFAPENMAWSADAKKIVFQGNLEKPPNPNNPEIYVYSLETKKVAQITKNANFDGDPSFSPDGKEIVFASDRDRNLEIYLMNEDGTNIRRLTDDPAHDSFPKFAPDGTQITFNSNRGGEATDVFIMNKDGKSLVRLTDWKTNEISRGGLSPDGTRLAFNSNHNGIYQLYVKDIEPFAPKLLLSDENDLQTPNFSPNGSELIYSVKFADKTGELRILNLSDKKNRLLLKTSSGNNYPQWSPDGNRIAFHQEVEGKWDIFKIKNDGTELTKLTDHPASDSLPKWFPDGAGLIFRTTRNGDASLSEIYQMNADGSGQTPLSIEKGYLGWSTVSPDGKYLIYSCNRQQLRGGKLNLCSANADGSEEKLLLERSGDNIHAAFSPDGKKIAFVSSGDGNPEIYLMNADGTNLLRLTRNLAVEANPTFSPDGKSIVFSSNRSGKFALYTTEFLEND